MSKYIKKHALTEAAIDEISEETAEICKSAGYESKDILTMRLTVEECLYSWLQQTGSTVDVELSSHRHLGTTHINLYCKGEALKNPFLNNSGDLFGSTLLRTLNQKPDYYSHNGVNTLHFRLKKKEMNIFMKLAMILSAAMIIGLGGLYFLPETIISAVNQYFIVPTYDKFLDILGCIAGPLIFFSVIWGICSIGDVATFSMLGKKLISTFLRNCLLISMSCLTLIPLIGMNYSSSNTSFHQLYQAYNMLLGLFPKNIIEPFSTGNSLQIIVLAIIVGTALLYLGRRSNAIAKAVEQVNYLVSFIMEFISKLVPFLVIFILVSFIWSKSLNSIRDCGTYISLVLMVFFLLKITIVLVTAVKQKMNPLFLIKKGLEPYFIALTTASSAAAFSTMVRNCEQKFGINRSLSDFGIPLGFIVQKYACAANYFLAAIFIAKLSNTECSLSWIIMTVFVAVLTAVATPPVPGGGTIGYTVLFLQLGLPQEYLGIALSLEMVLDFFITSTEVFSLQYSLTNIASQFNLLDPEVLRRR